MKLDYFTIKRNKNGKIRRIGFTWKLHKALKDKSSYPSLCHLKKEIKEKVARVHNVGGLD